MHPARITDLTNANLGELNPLYLTTRSVRRTVRPPMVLLALEVVWLREQVPGPGNSFPLERQWFQRHVSVC